MKAVRKLIVLMTIAFSANSYAHPEIACGKIEEGKSRAEVFQEAYRFAKDSRGMWIISDSTAAQIASEISQQRRPEEALNALKTAYKFAKDSRGMWISDNAKARAIALEIASQRNPETVVSCYQEAYKFGKSSRGLWTSDENSRAHAEDICFRKQRRRG